jgi:hypothetical protein
MFSCYKLLILVLRCRLNFFELQTDPGAPAIPSRKYASLQTSNVEKPGEKSRNTLPRFNAAS